MTYLEYPMQWNPLKMKYMYEKINTILSQVSFWNIV